MSDITTFTTLPNGGDNLLGEVIDKALKAYHGVLKDREYGYIFEAWRLQEVTLLEEIATLAGTYGLVATLRSLHAFYARHNLPEAPPALEPFLEGNKSHWKWLDSKLTYQAKLRRKSRAKFGEGTRDESRSSAAITDLLELPNPWLGLLAEHGLDDKVFLMWSQVSIDSLESGVWGLFERAVGMEIYRGATTSLRIPDLASCPIHLGNGVSLTLPEWEATTILEKILPRIVKRLEWHIKNDESGDASVLQSVLETYNA